LFVYLPWFIYLPLDIHDSKIYFSCNIFLSQYCASKCLVWIRPKGDFFIWSLKYIYFFYRVHNFAICDRQHDTSVRFPVHLQRCQIYRLYHNYVRQRKQVNNHFILFSCVHFYWPWKVRNYSKFIGFLSLTTKNNSLLFMY
jgi:hypothetical protein